MDLEMVSSLIWMVVTQVYTHAKTIKLYTEDIYTSFTNDCNCPQPQSSAESRQAKWGTEGRCQRHEQEQVWRLWQQWEGAKGIGWSSCQERRQRLGTNRMSKPEGIKSESTGV